MSVTDIKFQAAKNNADELMNNLQKMMAILTELEAKTESMRWSGSNATSFKDSIKKAKEELDNLYKNKISHIPEQIESSVRRYQMYEQ